MKRKIPSSFLTNLRRRGWYFCVLLFAAYFVGCNNTDKVRIEAIADRSQIPILNTDSVSTLISDSGITRYRIAAQQWEIYDKATPPYWEFERGIYLEKFNEDFEIEASLKANYARYDDAAKIWELDGDVVAMNIKGEQFNTEQLFWDQQTGRVYSDSSITVTRESSRIVGVGFESNQDMTKYTILQPQGVFPIKDNE